MPNRSLIRKLAYREVCPSCGKGRRACDYWRNSYGDAPDFITDEVPRAWLRWIRRVK